MLTLETVLITTTTAVVEYRSGCLHQIVPIDAIYLKVAQVAYISSLVLVFLVYC